MSLDGTDGRIWQKCVLCTMGCSRYPSVYPATLELLNVFALVVAALRSRPCRSSLSRARRSFTRNYAENKRPYSNVYVVQTTPYTCKSSASGAYVKWRLCMAWIGGSITRLSTSEILMVPPEGRSCRLLR